MARFLCCASMLLLALAAGCAPGDDVKPAEVQERRPMTPDVRSFVNKVWVVAASPHVAVGDTRVFLADGLMVMTSPHANPALGRWRYQDGRLIITEESRDYPVEIVALTDEQFDIRVHGPGEPVEIRLVPAEHPAVEAGALTPWK